MMNIIYQQHTATDHVVEVRILLNMVFLVQQFPCSIMDFVNVLE
jgi:hypothetical protein